MSEPHVCPVCKGCGERILLGVRVMGDPCPACKGACVLWEPERAVRQLLTLPDEPFLQQAKQVDFGAEPETWRPRFKGELPIHHHDNCGLIPCPGCLEFHYGFKVEKHGR